MAPTDFDNPITIYMTTIDEQLDAATAQVSELTAQLAEVQTALDTAKNDLATAETVNAELTDNLTTAKEKLAAQEVELREARAQISQLQAEARTAEERAAEFYGTKAGNAASVTPKGDAAALPVAERFKAITTPQGQTQFLRSLSDAERAELYSNI